MRTKLGYPPPNSTTYNQNFNRERQEKKSTLDIRGKTPNGETCMERFGLLLFLIIIQSYNIELPHIRNTSNSIIKLHETSM